jgi:hypothetical protein
MTGSGYGELSSQLAFKLGDIQLMERATPAREALGVDQLSIRCQSHTSSTILELNSYPSDEPLCNQEERQAYPNYHIRKENQTTQTKREHHRLRW